MTAGASAETADGMSEAKIDQIIEAMRHERYRFAPARRVLHPEKEREAAAARACRHGQISWSAKWCASCWRPTTSRSSLTARTGSGKGAGATPRCGKSSDTWTGTVWFIEGDISDCFGSLDHEILVGILAEKIHDNRFLRLIGNMLKAGYLEDWEYRDTLSGCPQGGVVSPILSNIYLDKLDKFVEQELIPQTHEEQSAGTIREYRRLNDRRRRARRRGDRAAARELLAADAAASLWRPDGPRHTGACGTAVRGRSPPGVHRAEGRSRGDQGQLAAFLRETLALELSAGKTLITHARTRAARFLGYEITVRHCDSKITRGRRMAQRDDRAARTAGRDQGQVRPYRQHGKPWHRARLQNLDDYDIVRIYGAEYRGVVNYYLLAQDVWRLRALRWNAETSMLKTLAAKHKSTVTKMAARYKAKIETPHGLRTCFEARVHRDGKPDLVARFGGIPLLRNRRAVIADPVPVPVPIPRKELIHRLRTRRCELCEQHGTVAVHQVASSPGSGHQDQASPRGRPSWPGNGARRSSSAIPATTPSTQPLSRTRRKSLESPVR